MSSDPGGRRWPAKLKRGNALAPPILSVLSMLVTLAVVSAIVSNEDSPSSHSTHQVHPPDDVRTPERAAEAYFDACRRRDPRGPAASSPSGAPAERMTSMTCSRLAGSEARLIINESRELPDGRIELRALAQGRRRAGPATIPLHVHVVLAPHTRGWYVQRMLIPQAKASGQNSIARSPPRRPASKAPCRTNAPCSGRRRNTAGRDGSKSKWRHYFDPAPNKRVRMPEARRP